MFLCFSFIKHVSPPSHTPLSSQNLVEHLKFDEVRSADSKLKRIMEHRFMSAPQVGPSEAVKEYLKTPAAVKYLAHQKTLDNTAKKERRGKKPVKTKFTPPQLQAIGEHLDSLGVKNGDNVIHVTAFAKCIKMKESEQAAAKAGGVDRLEDMSIEQVASRVESIKQTVQYVDEEEDEEEDEEGGGQVQAGGGSSSSSSSASKSIVEQVKQAASSILAR